MGAKATFDPLTRIIQLTEAPDGNGDVTLDVQVDLYSDGKEDWVANENLRRLRFPIRTVAGDSVPGGKALGDAYFLASDWKIRPYNADHRLIVVGDFWSEDGSDPYLDTVGAYTCRVMQEYSTLSRLVTGSGGISKSDVQDAMTDQGYTTGRAPNLDNMDYSVADLSDEVLDSRFDDAVYVSDAYGGTSGDDLGTRQNPARWQYAPGIATTRKVRRFIFVDAQTYTLGQAFVNYVFEGENFATLNMNGQNIAGSNVHRMVVTGQGSPTALLECYVTGATFATITFRCIFVGGNTISGNSTLNQSYFNGNTFYRNSGNLDIFHASGQLYFDSWTNGSAYLYDFHGQVYVSSNNTGGGVYFRDGSGLLQNTSGGMNVFAQGFVDARTQAPISGYVESGGDDTDVHTNISGTYGDDYFKGMKLVVVGYTSTKVAVGNIVGYTNTNGVFTLETALPYTPGALDRVFVITDTFANLGSVPGSVLEELIVDHKDVAGSVAETLYLLRGNVGGGVLLSSLDDGTMHIYDDDNTTEIARFACWKDEAKTERTYNPAEIVARTRIPIP